MQQIFTEYVDFSKIDQVTAVFKMSYAKVMHAEIIF